MKKFADGHPVYTYSGDSKAGQAWGEGLNLNGKLWYAISPSGVAMTASKVAARPQAAGAPAAAGERRRGAPSPQERSTRHRRRSRPR